MEHLILLFPLLGMEFDGKSLRFGQSREEVEELLGTPERARGSRCYYFDGELALDYGGEGTLNFIEFLGGPEGALQPKLYGVHVFEAEADEVYDLLAGRNGDDVDDSEAGYSYAFRSLSVGLYREITPENVTAMVREMSRMDMTALSEFDLEAENRRANHWATVGIGEKDYYA